MNLKGKIYLVRYIIILIIIFTFSIGLFAQADYAKLKPKVEVIGRAQKDRIMLRWAPNKPILWELGNKYGYVIERYTVIGDDKISDKAEKRILTQAPLKPLPIEAWKNLIKQTKYGAIAGQALFGEKIELDDKSAKNLMSIVNKAKESELRFSFALFSADQSLEVAQASALFYADSSAKPNEKYLYKIYSAIPQNILEQDTGFVFIGLKDFKELPKPVQLRAEFGDHSVNLSWNREYFHGIYTSFIVERSDDGGKTFHSISDLPIVNTIPEGRPDPELMYKMDSLPENGFKYFYRIKGITPFQEISEPSEVVSGMGIGAISDNPIITEGKEIAGQKIKIEWAFPEKYKIKGFKVRRTENSNIAYDDIAEVASGIREFVDSKPRHTNYYIITAFDETGRSKSSFAKMVQLVDSFPPSPPVGLIGKVDTTGIVTLKWKANKEEDIQGYRIYRANYATEEYSQITVAPVRDTVFVDTVEIKTLTKQVHYQVMAIDLRENHSGFSAPLSLNRPDILPPVSPVFSEVTSDEKGVNLFWHNSTSNDVVKTVLYKRPIGEQAWETVAVFDTKYSVNQFTDGKTGIKKTYEYTLIAVDDNKLESAPATPVSAKRIDNGIRPVIEKIYSKADRDKRQIDLAWEYNSIGVERIQIYKADKEGLPRLYKTLEGDVRTFTDRGLTVNTIYKYRIKAIYYNGAHTPLSKEIAVNY